MGASKGDVVIAGGGIGGVSAAIGLANLGYKVTVLEQAPQFGEIGAGIQIGPNAFHAMDYLGVGDAGRAKAVYIDRLVMMDGLTGSEIAHIDVGEAFRARFRNPYAVIHRADLHAVFLEACQAHPNIRLVNNQLVLGYANTPRGAKVITASGDSFEADAVIGADGVRSRIRAQLAGNDELKLSGHVAYRAVLSIDEMPEDLRWNAATLWAGPKCHMVHYPLQGWKTFNLVATFVTNVADVGSNEPGTREEILDQFGQIVPKARKLLEVPKSWRRWVLGDRDPIENWVDGRVVLLGDAAHPTHQYFAQGACMAMEDSVMLAHQLEKHGGDFAAAFAEYQQARIVRAYRVVLSSRAIGKHVYHAEGAERLVRNAVMGAKTQDEWCESLAWLYGGTGLTTITLQAAA
ncbi:3-hydroxybenzoate 6-hydroxylase [Rhodovastum atsumiense]|uniref:3-hydroxybenzoate 6-monooxygenase n=1 Tax=Rhodovastum atsumiense TaxID=504468 RepID=A0A5M6IQZ5_9PROT|nr:3-hydroxybenzoate 6-monooxygenase [Rhodovastum atsumiense]KAA5610601.1 3-hydroxybenzoate 6-monooxygenase [Rhodovastum atsumiense]CAH2600718.1 3-hydroxybenzoate 6-hydroxylase [Rhodovastum atsumiense]